jgi:cell division protein FtsW
MFFTTLLLVVVGLAMVFSASAVVAQERYHSEFADVGRQAGWALAGVVAMAILMHVDYSFYKSPKFIYPALCVTTLLLVLVFFIPGSHNVHRWIRFGGHFTFSLRRSQNPSWCCFWPGFCTRG